MVSDIQRTLSKDNYIKFMEDLQVGLSWQWDSRFRAALAHLRSDTKNRITAMLESYLGPPWDSGSIDTAPENVQSLVAPLGGVMHGQLFYTAGLSADTVVFASWWPWNNGQTISLRIGINHDGSSLLDTLVPPGVR